RGWRGRSLGDGPGRLEAQREVVPALQDVLARPRVPDRDPARAPFHRAAVPRLALPDGRVAVRPGVIPVRGLALDPVRILARRNEAPARRLDRVVVTLPHEHRPGEAGLPPIDEVVTGLAPAS